MKKLRSILVSFSSLKFTAGLLVAFLLLTFWGVLAQANAEAAGIPAASAAERFFDSYFVWVLGYVPLPAFKCVAALGCINVVASLVFRMPRGFKNAGLWLMHIALLVLLAGGIAGSEFKREYNGFGLMPAGDAPPAIADVKFYASDDSLGANPVLGADLEGRFTYTFSFKGSLRMSAGKDVALFKALYDPFRFVPYAFMVLFLLGAAFHYFVKVRGTRRDGRNGAGAQSVKVLPLLAFLLLVLPADSRASARPVPVWESLHADSPVLVDSVVRPFDSFARGFLDDLSGHVTYKCGEGDGCEGKLNARSVVRQILLVPGEAARYRIFRILRSDVLEALHLPAEARYVSYADLVPARSLLELYASREDGHPATAEMKRVYANVLQYEAVANRSAFSVVGKKSPQYPTINFARISTEVAYHAFNPVLCGFVAALLACLLASLNLVLKRRKLDIATNVFCIATAVILVIVFAVRTYVAAQVPLSSLYEIVLLVALLLMAFETGAFLLCKHRTFSLVVPVTLMATGLLFFAKFVLEPGDTFRPIPAVLNSSVFLTLHVFTIALGFAGVILSGVIAHLSLFRFRNLAEPGSAPAGASPLDSLLYGTLVFGMVFTALGTLLGGVWADFAWGRFWGFDPKECGALFVVLWTLLALHLRAGRLVSPRGFALFNCFNVIVTFLCWFGVNLLGVGLHSYGFQNGTAIWLAAFVIGDMLFILLIERLVALRSGK